jgi:16S rRNA G527 N7-methylase RsmG
MRGAPCDRSRIEEWIDRRATRCGFASPPDTSRFLAFHACRVLEEAAELKLTSIRDPDEFLERHVGESLEGAALIPRGTTGLALDLGSGNGYPGIPVAAMHPGLRMHLTDPSPKKVLFLRSVVERSPLQVVVLPRAIERASNLSDLPEFVLITTRAMGGWQRIVPRLVSKLAAHGRVVLWAGADAREVGDRVSWRALRLADEHPLPERDRSWIFVYCKNTSIKKGK